MIEYHDPVAATNIENIPYALSIPIAGSNQVHVGFLANGFPDSVNFLDALQVAMKDLEPGITLHAWNKGNASVPANDEMLAEITDSCQAVVAAYGH
ncbi:MAG: hypothetical protein O3B72_12100 [Proteobacteria bacterium]|jgi:hypothetical protein|nr:hypothetical protein [Pseudomonadota bacterium]